METIGEKIEVMYHLLEDLPQEKDPWIMLQLRVLIQKHIKELLIDLGTTG